MKKLIFFTILFFTYSIATFSQTDQCVGCNNNDNSITSLGQGNFTATGAQAYYWEICDGTATIVGSNTNQNVTLNCSQNNGTFKLKLTRFSNGNCYESCQVYNCGDCNPIIHEDNCPEDAYIHLDNENYICETLVLQLLNTGDANIDHVNWRYIYGKKPNITVITHQSIGNFPWYVTDEFTALQNRTIRVSAEIVLADGTVCTRLYENFIVNCSNNRSERISVSPNPLMDKIKIDLNNNNDVNIKKIEIYNNLGNLIFNKYQKFENTFYIDLSNQKVGVYFIKITFQDGSLERKTIIKK